MRLLILLLLSMAAPRLAVAEPRFVIDVLAHTGERPFGLDEVVSELTWGTINASGDVAMPACLGRRSDPEDLRCSALLVFRSGMASVVARHGDRAPGTPDGVVFTAFDAPVRIDDDGRVTFRAFLSNMDPVRREQTTWTASPDGSIAPATADALRGAAQMGSARVNAAGQGAVFAGGRRNAIIAPGKGGEPTRIAAEGDPAPGIPGGTFMGFDSQLEIDAAGRTAFRGYALPAVGGLGQSGIWRSDGDGALALVALGGEPWPGRPGEIMRSVGLGAMNDAGALYVEAWRYAPGRPGETFALVHVGADGTKRVVIETGTTLDPPRGDARKIVKYTAYPLMGSGVFPGARGMNDRSQIPVSVVLDDGSLALVVATLRDGEP